NGSWPASSAASTWSTTGSAGGVTALSAGWGCAAARSSVTSMSVFWPTITGGTPDACSVTLAPSSVMMCALTGTRMPSCSATSVPSDARIQALPVTWVINTVSVAMVESSMMNSVALTGASAHGNGDHVSGCYAPGVELRIVGKDNTAQAMEPATRPRCATLPAPHAGRCRAP